jgi:hypothetical protein
MLAPHGRESRLDPAIGNAGGGHHMLGIGAPHDRKLALAIHPSRPG